MMKYKNEERNNAYSRPEDELRMKIQLQSH